VHPDYRDAGAGEATAEVDRGKSRKQRNQALFRAHHPAPRTGFIEHGFAEAGVDKPAEAEAGVVQLSAAFQSSGQDDLRSSTGVIQPLARGGAYNHRGIFRDKAVTWL